MNAGFGLVGPDPQHPAGASIGRALRLIMQNVGGALPGVGSMAMFGGMRYTNAVFAEDEAGLPAGWAPLASTRFAMAPGVNAATVYIATSASNIMRRGVGKEAPEEEGTQSLQRVAAYLGSPNPHYTHGWSRGTPGLLVISRGVARGAAPDNLVVVPFGRKREAPPAVNDPSAHACPECGDLALRPQGGGWLCDTCGAAPSMQG